MARKPDSQDYVPNQRQLPGWLPTQMPDGSIRQRATGIEARSTQAKRENLRGVQYDTAGNVVRAKSAVSGNPTNITPNSRIDQFKEGKITPTITERWGVVSPERKKLLEASQAREAAVKARIAAGTNRVQAHNNALYDKVVAPAMARNAAAVAADPTPTRSSAAVAAAGKQAMAPDAQGRTFTVQTPWGSVGIRNMNPPNALATARQPNIPTASAMTPAAAAPMTAAVAVRTPSLPAGPVPIVANQTVTIPRVPQPTLPQVTAAARPQAPNIGAVQAPSTMAGSSPAAPRFSMNPSTTPLTAPRQSPTVAKPTWPIKPLTTAQSMTLSPGDAAAQRMGLPPPFGKGAPRRTAANPSWLERGKATSLASAAPNLPAMKIF